MYTKILQGWVEQTYDDDGNPIEQVFVPSGEVDRRNEEDDPIEDPEELARIEDKEKFWAMEMIQP